MLAHCMKKEKIDSPVKLASKLMLDDRPTGNHVDVLEFMRSPTEFERGETPEETDRQLLALCDLEVEVRFTSPTK